MISPGFRHRFSVVAVTTLIVVTSTIATLPHVLKTSTASAASPAPWCTGNALRAFEEHGEGLGTMYVTIIFVNQFRGPCSLEGFPTVTFVNRAGPLRHETQSDSGGSGSSPHRITIPKDGVAGFVLEYTDSPVTGGNPQTVCHATVALQVSLAPVRSSPLAYNAWIELPLDPCYGGFTVTPVQRGIPRP